MEHAENLVEQIEISNRQAKDRLAVCESLKILLKNKHFKTVIMDHYFKEYPAALVLTKADPAQQDEAAQKSIDNAIIAVGELNQFFRSIMVQGDMAKKALADNDALLRESLEEADGE